MPFRDNVETCVISGFRREVIENPALLGYYAPSDGNILPIGRTIGCPETCW